MFLVYKLRVDAKLRAGPGLNPTLFLVLLVRCDQRGISIPGENRRQLQANCPRATLILEQSLFPIEGRLLAFVTIFSSLSYQRPSAAHFHLNDASPSATVRLLNR